MNTPFVARNFDNSPNKETSLLPGKVMAYWAKECFPVFYFDDSFPPDTPLVRALPGMVGISERGDELYVILKDHSCEKICVLNDDIPRAILTADACTS